MAIFNNSDDTPTQNNNNTTIITEGSLIKGEMTLDCNLYIDGEFEGKIHSKKLITIGKSGKVRGEIHTHHLVVQGSVEGSVDSNRLEIMSAGKVLGSILTGELIIEAKGHFEGESKIKNKELKNKAVNTVTDEKQKQA
jgi:cytoskeletal protein CcmA (bactofilin family)